MGSEKWVDKVMIFIDGSNLFRTFKQFRPDIDYSIKKLVNILIKGRKLIRPYYFGSIKYPPPEGQIKFYDGIRYEGIDVTTRPLKIRTRPCECPTCKHQWTQTIEIEKGVDVALITKMLSFGFKNAYDVAILVSGDADYIEAVEQIRDLGKRVEIISFKGAIAPGLRKIADIDGFIALDDIADQIKK